MAINCCQNPIVDYFSTQKRPQNSISTFGWDSSSYNDSAVASDSCDSTLPSPISPEPLAFPPAAYNLPKQEANPDIKSEQTFNFGTFEEWMRWDDPSDAALSPTSEEYFPNFKAEPTSPSMSGLEFQGSGYGTRGSNMTDESAVFGEDPMNEEPLFQTPDTLLSPPMTDIPNREGLYSTPLSWTRPTSGTRQAQQYSGRLTPQEESKLRSIAMPSMQAQYPASPTSSPSSPDPTGNRKRKSSLEGEEEDDESTEPTNGRCPPVKKTAHNMIEKRYRTNLNDKIAALRDSVPSLRVMSKKNSRGEDIQEDLQGLTPAHKLNKATVLSKATEYIAHLEKRNKYLIKENASLKSRVDAFEILVMARQPQNMQQNNNMNRSQRTSIAGGQQQLPSRQQYLMDGMMGPI
ncbi:helix-loop-helix DNA-binding domain-containing protein [Rhexocercosporidium sp. MPI-PUGE-AT-0058]|nr:helix-loop-helix DNA-binding domain-containing protein [Rhexocercosporidium sp. MPI-PUGE-AT-0058]